MSDHENRRVAIVTGANSGIGAATAQELARTGIAVVVAYKQVPVWENTGTPDSYNAARMTSGEEVASSIRQRGGEAVAMDADLLDPKSPQALFDFAEESLGPVDILINNASGWLHGDSFLPYAPDEAGRTSNEVTDRLIDLTLGIDAKATALMIGEFSRRYLARKAAWGRIVGLTSGGRDGFPGEVSYGAAKAALESYTLSAAKELARTGITANVVYPPVTDTGWVNDGVRQFVATDPDHIHVAEPIDVAQVIAWLCSDAARMVTGNVIRMR
jgi:3-oxoacyl-[acyl-carrier protein] reductase